MTASQLTDIDQLVDECVRRCLADAQPLSAFVHVLEAVAFGSNLTPSQLEEIKWRTMSRIVEAEVDDDVS